MLGGEAPDASGQCLDSDGGDGGQGASIDVNSLSRPGEEPKTGGRMGGEAGTSSSVAGQDGGAGTSLASVVLAPATRPSGGLTWLIPSGQPDQAPTYTYDGDGADGQDGMHGGGGTGGGGGWNFTDAQGTRFAGGGGGAGGSGGCGGKKGLGGQAGGSSFGLVIINSPDTLLEASSFLARAGGKGGPPGAGGEGGRGGLGGNGTFSQNNPGGDGGDGGDGQQGSNGAPGAGGHSMGILCNTGLLTSLEDVTAEHAVPGEGASYTEGGEQAPDGQAHETLGCTP